MPPDVYYDTCVFLEAYNDTHPEQAFCELLTDPSKIRWDVCICSELISSESSATELLNQFLIACALHGRLVKDIELNASKPTQKKHVALKKTLAATGLANLDWKHLMCAVAHPSEYLCSVDEDFWDSANKANPKAKIKSEATKKIIEARLAILIRHPSEIDGLL